MGNLKFKLNGALKLSVFEPFRCRARRRMRYEEEDEDGSSDEDCGYNKEIAKLEMYSQSLRDEDLLVAAMVDDQQVEVLLFKVPLWSLFSTELLSITLFSYETTYLKNMDVCLLYTSPSPRDGLLSRMPSSA